MMNQFNRRQILRAAGGLASMCAIPAALGETSEKMQAQPLLRRIKIATIGAPDVSLIEAQYTQWLNYKTAATGKISEAMARSWGTPSSAGRPFVMLQPESGDDVFIRAVEIDAVPEYRPMTTLGWNAIEIIVDDVYKTREALSKSPFEIIGEPHSLGGQFASIHAMQFVGPANEVVYLTTETGDREKSTLPPPASAIDRPFIMVLAGHDLEILVDFYATHFNLSKIPIFPAKLSLVRDAQSLDADHTFTMSLLRGGERGNTIELDGYPLSAGQRARPAGQLPPGVAMTSFTVPSLGNLKIPFIAEPQPLYDGRLAATFVGPAGELTELIEEP